MKNHWPGSKWFIYSGLVNSWLVINRELLKESRSLRASLFRTIWVVVLIGVLGLIALSPNGLTWEPGQGNTLFQQANLALFSLIWLVGPLMTCDSVSREKREGTLELLVLAPLGTFDILIAKGFVHGLRASVCLMATAPVIMIPIFLGGVHGLDVARMLLLHATAIVLALLAGVISSVLHSNAGAASRWALILSGVLLMSLGTVYVTGSIVSFLLQSGGVGIAIISFKSLDSSSGLLGRGCHLINLVLLLGYQSIRLVD